MVDEVANKMDMGVDPYFHRTNTLSTGSRPCVTKDKVKPKGPIPSGRGPVWGSWDEQDCEQHCTFGRSINLFIRSRHICAEWCLVVLHFASQPTSAWRVSGSPVVLLFCHLFVLRWEGTVHRHQDWAIRYKTDTSFEILKEFIKDWTGHYNKQQRKIYNYVKWTKVSSWWQLV